MRSGRADRLSGWLTRWESASPLQSRWLVLVVAALFLAAWWPTLSGSRVLVQASTYLYYGPWNSAAGAPPGRLHLVDPAVQLTPWLGLVRDGLLHFRLPLWNPYSGSGMALLANDQASVFSPFTWVGLPSATNVGFSLGCLAKMWVGGLGTRVWLRRLGISPWSATLAAVVYGSGSALVIWLSYPNASVTALTPFLFAAVEWWFQRRDRVAVAGIAASVALLLVAGHVETVVQVLTCLALYIAVRLVVLEDRRRLVAGVVAGVVLGTGIAAIQVVPVAAHLFSSNVTSGRAGLGLAHLSAGDLVDWIIPNRRGNPAIDGLNERYMATAYVGIGALLLAALGAVRAARTRWNPGIAMLVFGTFAGGVAYGVLTPIVGRLPGFSVSQTSFFVFLPPLAAAGLAAFGLDSLLVRGGVPADRELASPRTGAMPSSAMPSDAAALRPAAVVAAAVGAVALGAVVAAGLLFAIRGAAVETMFPHVRHYLGFWIAFPILAAVAAGGFLAAGRMGVSHVATLGFTVLALVEGAVFAVPFNDQVPAASVPPPSRAMAWLAAHRGGPFAASGSLVPPDTSVLYRVRDVRFYDPASLGSRADTFTRHAGLGETRDATGALPEPQLQWLRMARVQYYMTDRDIGDAGSEVFSGEGVRIFELPNSRPELYLSEKQVPVRSLDDAVTHVDGLPSGADLVEQAAPAGNGPGAGGDADQGGGDGQGATASGRSVSWTEPRPEVTDARVRVERPSVLVRLVAFDPNWHAYVDGQRTTISAANVMYQSIVVPAGSHRVIFRYEPISIPIGAAISLLSLAGLSGLAVSARRRDARRPSGTGPVL